MQPPASATVPSRKPPSSHQDGLTVHALAKRLTARLVELDAERERIAEALVVLNGPRSSKLELSTRILDAVGEEPGVRASMLALVCRIPAAAIKSELDALNRAGVVERDGLGWKLATPAPAGA